ncbi:MAG: Cna B-type domain-containing protein [Clostridiales bacterium]|nr:Cna B-type domain-containing protein [Clostridiales bacterium]
MNSIKIGRISKFEKVFCLCTVFAIILSIAACGNYGSTSSQNIQSTDTGIINGSITFTNALEADKTEVTVCNAWIDSNNCDNTRPENGVTFRLLQNDVELESYTMEAPWDSYTFGGLDKYDENQVPYVYTVTEDEIPGYSSTDTGDRFVTFTNTLQVGEVTGMDLAQIQAGNYSSLQGTWTEVAYAVNYYNPDDPGVHWKAGASSPDADTLFVSSDKIVFNDAWVVVQGNILTDNAGSHPLLFENSGISLVASIPDSHAVAINWAVSFCPKGAPNALQPDNGVIIDNTKSLIVIWTSNMGYTAVFAQT